MERSELIWKEISLPALRHNIGVLRKLVGTKTKMAAVIKANAYGHGAPIIAKTALAAGVDYLAVARVNEAVELRENGITAAPILILSFCMPQMTRMLIKYNITQSIHDEWTAQMVSAEAEKLGAKVKVHLKVDTGMGRVGFIPDALLGNSGFGQALNAIKRIMNLPGLRVEGIFTHLADSDNPDPAPSQRQIALFNEFVDLLAENGIKPEIVHAANSAGFIQMDNTHYNMVRMGIAMYGLEANPGQYSSRLGLIPIMSLKTRVVHLKRVPAGFKVSYGSTYTTTQETVLATVAIGYADGYKRAFSHQGEMLVRGQRAKVVGRVCMDLTVIDVTHIPDVHILDEVTIFGHDSYGNCLSVDELAQKLDTLNYELIITTVPERVAFYYLEDEE